MFVEGRLTMPVPNLGVPRSMIGFPDADSPRNPLHSPPITAPMNAKRPEPDMVQVVHPTTGEVLDVTPSNARDMVRLDGWLMHVKNEPKQDESEEEENLDDDGGSEPKLDEEGKPVFDADELGQLRKEFYELAGHEADGRFGKKALNEAIAKLKEAPPAAAAAE